MLLGFSKALINGSDHDALYTQISEFLKPGGWVFVLFLVFACICVYAFTCMRVCVYEELMCRCVCECMWRPELNAWCLPWSSLAFCAEEESLTCTGFT